MKIVLLVVFLSLSLAVSATRPGSVLTDTLGLQVTVRQDPRVDLLLQQHRDISISEQGIRGFRVQVSTDSGNQSKQRTQRRKAEFDLLFPGVSSYIIFDSPEFKLRVGNFRTRLDAQRFLEKMSGKYPAAFIVVDRINFPDFEN